MCIVFWRDVLYTYDSDDVLERKVGYAGPEIRNTDPARYTFFAFTKSCERFIDRQLPCLVCSLQPTEEQWMDIGQKKVSGFLQVPWAFLCGSRTITARVGSNWFAISASSSARVITRFLLLAESPFHSTPIADVKIW
jgi:hypothetical protein